MQAVVALADPCLPAARPFLKWAGGKRRVVPHLLEHLEERPRRYFEPFLGGGALFFNLAQERDPAEPWAVLGDLNIRLVRTWRGIRDDLEVVLDRLAWHEQRHCEAHYYATRATDIDSEASDGEVAAWMTYLNRTGFNGLYRVNRKGGFNVPFGRYAKPRILDEENLLATSRALQSIDIRVGDFAAVFHSAEAGDLVYLDPPYVPLSSTASFTSYTQLGFGMKDHERLRDLAQGLRDRGVQVLLSNHDTPEVRELYRGWRFTRIMVGRAINSKANARGPVAELIIH